MNNKVLFILAFLIFQTVFFTSCNNNIASSKSDANITETPQPQNTKVPSEILEVSSGIATENSTDIDLNNKSLDDFTIGYNASDTSLENLTLISNHVKKSIEDKYSTISDVSPSMYNISYIYEYNWEVRGNVYIYNWKEDTTELIINKDTLEDKYTPKYTKWLDDRYLSVIIGYAYGTVSVGGDLYVYDTIEDSLRLIVKSDEDTEVKSVEIIDSKINLVIAKFNENYTDYEVIDKEYSIEDMLK